MKDKTSQIRPEVLLCVPTCFSEIRYYPRDVSTNQIWVDRAAADLFFQWKICAFHIARFYC